MPLAMGQWYLRSVDTLTDAYIVPDASPLTRAAALLAKSHSELAAVLRDPSLWNVTVGTLLHATPPPKRSRRHLRAVPQVRVLNRKLTEALSSRELQVVQLVAEGLSNKQIGARLGLSDKTIKNHVSHILAKLQLKARTQVAIMALRDGIC
jgi:DNA-binding NarL/FixJ family response regulator